LCTPVSPLDVVAYYGLSVVEVTLPGNYGKVAEFIDIPEKKIYVNKEDPISRRTFTIAHEIGHYVLHKDEIQQDPDSYQVLFRDFTFQEDNLLEKEANTFAANLLVPAGMLVKLKDYSASILSTLFNVSQQVISYRLEDLKRGSGWAS